LLAGQQPRLNAGREHASRPVAADRWGHSRDSFRAPSGFDRRDVGQGLVLSFIARPQLTLQYKVH
jgi:hypothetical protein